MVEASTAVHKMASGTLSRTTFQSPDSTPPSGTLSQQSWPCSTLSQSKHVHGRQGDHTVLGEREGQ